MDQRLQSHHRQTGRGNSACFRVCSEMEMATWLWWKVCVCFSLRSSFLDGCSVGVRCLGRDRPQPRLINIWEEMRKKGYLRHVKKCRQCRACVRSLFHTAILENVFWPADLLRNGLILVHSHCQWFSGICACVHTQPLRKVTLCVCVYNAARTISLNWRTISASVQIVRSSLITASFLFTIFLSREHWSAFKTTGKTVAR